MRSINSVNITVVLRPPTGQRNAWTVCPAAGSPSDPINMIEKENVYKWGAWNDNNNLSYTYADWWDANGDWIYDDIPAGAEEGNGKGDDDQDHQPNDSPQRIHAEIERNEYLLECTYIWIYEAIIHNNTNY